MVQKRDVHSKRGQITLFIIIGIALVILVGIFFMVKDVSTVSETEGSLGLITEDVGTEFTPIQNYVDECIYSMAKEAVKKLGQQGGYVDSEMLSGNSNSPTDSSNSLVFFPGDQNYKIAYWWYLDSPNSCDEGGSCSFSSKKPPLTGNDALSIESQVESYVDKNMDECLSGFAPFKEQGYEFTSIGDLETDVSIAQNDVVVQLKYPIVVKKGRSKQEMSSFFTTLPVNLRRVYEFASRISMAESEGQFLEKQAMNLITIFANKEIGEKGLPPMYDVDLNTNKPQKTWSQQVVKDMLKNIFGNYVPFIQIFESANYQPIQVEDEVSQAIFNMMTLSINKSYVDFSVGFDYKGWWEPYLKMGTSEMLEPGRLGIPETGIGIIDTFTGFFSLNDYSFSYDFSYPVVVNLFDHYAFGGEGYSFKFALESNVRNNKPLNLTENLFSPSIVDSLYCNKESWSSANHTFKVLGEQGEYIEDVRISYNCGSHSCLLGYTKDYPLETKLPSCMGGYVRFNKQGYLNERKNLSVSAGTMGSHQVELVKFREVPIDVEVFEYVSGSSGLTMESTPRPLTESEVANLVFEGVGSNAQSDFVAVLEGSDDELPNVFIAPGTYDVEGQLLLRLPAPELGLDKVIVPKDTRRDCPLVCPEYTLPKVPFNEMFPEGGVYLDAGTGGPWEVTASELDGAEKITFRMIASPTNLDNLDHDDLEEMAKIEFYSRNQRLKLNPVIS